MVNKSNDVSGRFEQASGELENGTFVLRLYVTGATSRSIRAIENLSKMCKDHLDGRYELEVIDIYQKPHLAKRDQIVAAPTLIKLLPAPLRRFVGDLSDSEGVLAGLDLIEKRE